MTTFTLGLLFLGLRCLLAIEDQGDIHVRKPCSTNVLCRVLTFCSEEADSGHSRKGLLASGLLIHVFL